MSRRYLRDLTIIIIILALLVLVYIPQQRENMGETTKSGPVPYASGYHYDGRIGQLSVYIIESNMTVSQGTDLRFTGNSVEAYSTSMRQVSITVAGSLILENTSVSIMNASGNSIQSISINVIRGGSLFLYNSSFCFNGSVTGDGSTIKYENSTITTPPSGHSPWPGSARWLSQYYNDSRVWIYNSTINGLYKQSGQILFKAADTYMSDPFFARNGTITFTHPTDTMGANSFVNGINLSVAFFGNSNGTSGNLSIFYNGSSIANQDLIFDGGHNDTVNLHINVSADPRPVDWFANSSNFHAILQESGSGPIEITNITAALISNDTESVLGEEAYGLILDNSSLDAVNSSFGFNLEPPGIDGFPDYKSRHLWAYNSTMVMEDTGIGNDTYMGGTAFQLNDSRVFIYRSLRIIPMDNGSPIMNFRYSVQPEIAVPANETEWNGRSYPQAEISGTDLIILSGVLTNRSYFYTGDYGINWNGSGELISTKPYPFISSGQKVLVVQAQVPEILVDRINSQANSTMASVNLTYSVVTPPGETLSGNFTVAASSPSGKTLAQTGFSIGNSSGEFSRQIRMYGQWSQGDSLNIIFGSPQPYYMPSSSIGSAPLEYDKVNQSVPDEIHVSVYSRGIPGGLAWRLHAGNRSFWISGSYWIIDLTGYPLNFSAVPPTGYTVSLVFRNGSGSNGSLYANFTVIRYDVSFVHEGLNSNISWSLLISGREITTSSTSIEVNLTPGEHLFLIMVPGSVSSNVTQGMLNVSGNATVFFRLWHRTPWYGGLDAYLHSLSAYVVAVGAVAIAAIGLTRRKMHSWHLCRSCGISVERGAKLCPSCSMERGKGKY